MRYSTLGQEASQSLWQSLTGKVDEFRRHYSAWTSTGRQELPALERMLTESKARLSEAANVAYRAGDVEGMRAFNARVTEAEALLRDLAEVQSTASRWQSTWDTLTGWLTQAAWEYGSIGVGILPILAPVAIATAVAAVGALAWVINSWQTIRARSATIKDLADRVAAGQLTAEAAARLAAAAEPPGMFAGFGAGLGTVLPLLLIGGLALFLWRR